MQRVDDEYHFLLDCPELGELRNEFSPHFLQITLICTNCNSYCDHKMRKKLANGLNLFKLYSTFFNYTNDIYIILHNHYSNVPLLNISIAAPCVAQLCYISICMSMYSMLP